MKKQVQSTIFLLSPAVIFLLLLLIFPTGCKNYNEVDLYPPCDTVNVTYTDDIYPIVSANCLPCHTTVNAFGNVVLDNVDSARIVARNGLLLKAVNHDPSVVPMPKGGAKLPSCELSKFDAWVAHNEPE